MHDAMVQYSAPFHEYEGYVDHFCGSFRVNCGDHTHYRWADYEVTVIGNIHDNPELLEAQYTIWDYIKEVARDLVLLEGDCRVVDAIYAAEDVRRRRGTLTIED